MVMGLKRSAFERCKDDGLLRAIPPSKPQSDESLSASERWLKEAAMDQDGQTFNSSVIASYLAMFHAARAVLFRDGVRERSHFCIARYIEEVYVKKGHLNQEWIDLLDHARELRHEDQYDATFSTTEEEAAHALKTASSFVEEMKGLLKRTQGPQ
jgi:uncharacterized protein (UPF0332 family)